MCAGGQFMRHVKAPSPRVPPTVIRLSKPATLVESHIELIALFLIVVVLLDLVADHTAGHRACRYCHSGSKILSLGYGNDWPWSLQQRTRTRDPSGRIRTR